MNSVSESTIRVAIACGGTGGHLFPGLAVAEQLARRGCAVTLLVSPKEVDQQAVKQAVGMEIVTLPAVGLTRGQRLAFVRGFRQSYRAAKNVFQPHPPQAALAMGGFTSAPPILAAKRLGARTFLHESNTIPGRANRWLSWVVDRAFVGFPSTSLLLHNRNVTVTGTPVRPQFQPGDAGACRAALGLDPVRPVVLVMGGSQGASGINELVVQALPLLAVRGPEWQWFHLTGAGEVDKVRRAYEALKLKAVVHPFFAEMELALGAATAAISRAGASSLAEIAAMGLPAALVPYPAATDNHQFYNAQAFEQSGAARLLAQKGATVEALADLLEDLVRNEPARADMRKALAKWHAPQAAEEIAESILESVGICAARPQPTRTENRGLKMEESSADREVSAAGEPVGALEPGSVGRAVLSPPRRGEDTAPYRDGFFGYRIPELHQSRLDGRARRIETISTVRRVLATRARESQAGFADGPAEFWPAAAESTMPEGST